MPQIRHNLLQQFFQQICAFHVRVVDCDSLTRQTKASNYRLLHDIEQRSRVGMSDTNRKPLIGVTACRRQLDPHPFNIVGQKYIDGVVDGAGAMQMILKAFCRA